MATLLLTFLIFALAILGLAAGLLLSGRCLRGSCGGAIEHRGQSLACMLCPRRDKNTPADPKTR